MASAECCDALLVARGARALAYPSLTNLIPCLNGLDLGAGLLLQSQFASDGMTLTAVAYTSGPRPKLFISRTSSGRSSLLARRSTCDNYASFRALSRRGLVSRANRVPNRPEGNAVFVL